MQLQLLVFRAFSALGGFQCRNTERSSPGAVDCLQLHCQGLEQPRVPRDVSFRPMQLHNVLPPVKTEPSDFLLSFCPHLLKKLEQISYVPTPTSFLWLTSHIQKCQTTNSRPGFFLPQRKKSPWPHISFSPPTSDQIPLPILSPEQVLST